MPLRVHVNVGYRPGLGADELLAIVQSGLGDKYDVYKPGRLQVPDVMVKRSDSEGAAIQIVQRRLRRRTLLRVYPLAPSIAERSWRPVGMAQQRSALQPLTDEVVAFLQSKERLRPEDTRPRPMPPSP